LFRLVSFSGRGAPTRLFSRCFLFYFLIHVCSLGPSSLACFEKVVAWAKLVLSRPGVARGRMVNRTWGSDSEQLPNRHHRSDFEHETVGAFMCVCVNMGLCGWIWMGACFALAALPSLPSISYFFSFPFDARIASGGSECLEVRVYFAGFTFSAVGL